MTPAEQLADRVHEILSALTPFTGHLDPGNVTARCDLIVADLAGGDPRKGAEAALSVMGLLWPDTTPEDCGHADWWQTGLGRLVARHSGQDWAVTHAGAAAILGVHPGTVAQLVHRGTLPRHPDGGVSRAAVLRRLAREW